MLQEISHSNLSHAINALVWQVAMGADEGVEDEAVEWFSLPVEKPNPAPLPITPTLIHKTPPPVQQQAPAPYLSQGTAALIASAREAAEKCQSVEELQKAIEAFEGCALKKLANKTVFAEGSPNASIMFIGEAPGADEDREGVPFCGASGRLLDKMLASIGLSRQSNAYITNSVFWRPPGNRTPTPEELEICRPFVEQHIALVNPKVLVLVGGAATKSVLQAVEGITRLRGKPLVYHNEKLADSIPTFAIFHPSYLLRQSAHKAYAWRDLLMIKQHLQTAPTRK